MSKLNTAERKALEPTDFALPEERKYPIHNEAHARAALSRVAQYGTLDEEQKVRDAVHKKYPEMGIKTIKDLKDVASKKREKMAMEKAMKNHMESNEMMPDSEGEGDND